jgi:hypothetical protein
MPNVVKYSATTQTAALKKSNYWIGVGDVDKGPTSSTDYWNGITPPSGGYTIYLNKASGGPSIYVAANDAELIGYTAMISGTTYASAALALQYYYGQTDKMVIDRDYEAVNTTNLAFSVDAAFAPSYPRTGTVVNDMGSSVVTQNLTNSPTFVSSGSASYWSFDGTNDHLSTSAYNAAFSINGRQAYTAEVWFYPLTPNSTTQYYMVYGSYSSVTGGNHGWGINFTQNPGSAASGYVTCYCERLWGTGNLNNAFETMPTGNFYNIWHQVVYVYDGSNVLMYRNGSLKMTTSSSFNVTNTAARLTLAARPSIASPNIAWTKVRVNNARFYSRALTATEILDNFNAQRGRVGL